MPCKTDTSAALGSLLPRHRTRPGRCKILDNQSLRWELAFLWMVPQTGNHYCDGLPVNNIGRWAVGDPFDHDVNTLNVAVANPGLEHGLWLVGAGLPQAVAGGRVE